ncbi:MAG: acyltransferase [Prevotella sp.]|nr:acyltransferase [Prevotella sp.]
MNLLNKKIPWYILYYGFAYHLPETRGNGIIGKLSGFLRYQCVRHIIKSCGTHVNIHRHAFFGKGQDIELGSYSDMGLDCHLPNDIKIGDYVMMAPGCFVLPQHTHDISDLTTPMNQQGRVWKPGRTVIGNDVWIGREVMITGGGHSIGNHSVIGARAVVSKSIPDWAIAAGNPIRIIRYRNQSQK